ncbi:hypothetical protein [Nocardioides daphniae]|uniref:hypothetical protein n=1 Tax=Nocardioides daphniae TaxID=402297 RepID=UPI001EE8AA82|nr:hypothetical protein [Nocardioides daphniae]
MERSCDLGLVALDAVRGQVRVGDAWGPVVPLRSAHRYLAGLARRFLAVRGHGKSAAWHVRELAEPLELPQRPSSLLPTARARLPYGSVPGGRHVPVPEEGLDRPAVERLCADASHLVVTPWRGVLIPEETA